MTEPARVPCCIRGCRRTFKAEDTGDGEIMCGRHYRCDRRLVDAFKKQKRIHALIARRLNRLWSRGLLSIEVAERRWARTDGRRNRAWAALKAEAQRQQDAGFFAPRPRRRKVPQSTFAPEISAGERMAANRFEADFQRLKQAQVRT